MENHHFIKRAGIVCMAVVIISICAYWLQSQPTRARAATVIPTPTPVLHIARPQTATHLKKIAVGSNFVLGLLNNDTLVMWGDNRKWQSTIPYRFKDTLFSDIATGASVSYVLDQTGNVSAWGDEDNYSESQVPTDAQSDVTAIAAGTRFAMALKTDGTVIAWGRNDFGQLDVPLSLNNVVAIAAGARHSLALRSDGRVVAWGDNRMGQLRVPATAINVIALAGGDDHSLALKSDGTVVAWGSNKFGQTLVPRLLNGVTAIAAGTRFSLALKSDGSVMAWGTREFGSISIPPRLTVAAIGAGYTNSVLQLTDGRVVTLGTSWFGSRITRTHTITPYYTPTETPTPSNTPSNTRTFTRTRTATNTPTRTNTSTNTSTRTATSTITATPSETLTPSETPTPSETLTPSQTPTPSSTLTPSKTSTPAVAQGSNPAITINGGGGALANGSDGVSMRFNIAGCGESFDFRGTQNYYNGCDVGVSLNIGGTGYTTFNGSGASSGLSNQAKFDTLAITQLTGSANITGASTTGDGSVVLIYTKTISGRRYELKRTITYTYPNYYYTDEYDIIIPAGTQPWSNSTKVVTRHQVEVTKQTTCWRLFPSKIFNRSIRRQVSLSA